MPDITDDATEREEIYRQSAIARVRAIAQLTANGSGICRLCGDAVEQDRLAVIPNAIHCSECAAAIEEDRARAAKRGI